MSAPQSDTPITTGAIRAWLPPIVTAGGMLVAGVTAWLALTARVATLEARVVAQDTAIAQVARLEPRLGDRLTRIEQLLAEMVCTQQPQDVERCRRATRIVGGVAGTAP